MILARSVSLSGPSDRALAQRSKIIAITITIRFQRRLHRSHRKRKLSILEASIARELKVERHSRAPSYANTHTQHGAILLISSCVKMIRRPLRRR